MTAAPSRLRRFWRRRAFEIVLFGMVFFSGAYFYNGMKWNQISRYDAIFSFVEPGSPDRFTFRIDHFISDPLLGINTGDWARNPEHSAGGSTHYYSNKAPGPMLLGIPLYFVIYATERMLGAVPETAQWTVFNCYLLNLLLTVLPLALSSIFFHRMALARCQGRRHWALALTTALYFGTLVFPYSTSFTGHATAAAFVVLGLYQYLRAEPLAYALSGLLIGLGVLTEYSVAITVSLLLVALLWRRQYAGLAAMATGGLLPLIAFMAYHRICFGEFFTTAIVFNNPHFIDEGAVGGLLTAETIREAGWGISFSPYRGLFWYMPLLLFLLAAALPLLKSPRRHWFYWLCLVNILGFFLMNITFNGWHGGACMGPRYQIPVLPFYLLLGCLPAGLLGKRRWRGPAFISFCLVAVVSAGNMFVLTAVSPFGKGYSPGKEAGWKNPLPHYYLILFKFSEMHIFGRAVLRGDPAPYRWGAGGSGAVAGLTLRPERNADPNDKLQRSFNLGQLSAIPGLWSLLPWLTGLLVLAAILSRTWSRPGQLPRDGPAERAAMDACAR